MREWAEQALSSFSLTATMHPGRAVLELNGMWQDRQKTARLIAPNSGGNTVYVSPGIRYAGGKNWNTALSIGTPIVKE